MGRYQVKVSYRGQKLFDVDADSQQEAEELAVKAWEGSPIPEFSDNADILSVKLHTGDIPKSERPTARPEAAVMPERKASEATIDAEVLESGAETVVEEPALPAFQPPKPSRRSLLPYLWTAFWIGVLIILARIGGQ